ncbi:hypothetical protein FA13DRAFT_1807248 [Coprinellus micaceus]|uniref:F-box domain-containing protein n=1 Tax=Coprinellus micaceus TaxID=71717 RepID=A0A4Y7RBD2_COPMI|nr:hypothetical protein FA13DRAFT_1807248 [Coprinellus micaceus]
MALSTLNPCPLPDLIWTLVGQDSDPLEVVMLERTCRKVYKGVNRIGVWKEVLKSVCEEYGIIAGTYNMEEMTLQDLKKAACRPEVWMSFLRRHHSATYPTFGGTIPRLSPIIHMPQAGYDR